MTSVLFESGPWFAWFPVRTQREQLAWLTTVFRERIVSAGPAEPWRYYTN